jgi:hypothetical protein
VEGDEQAAAGQQPERGHRQRGCPGDPPEQGADEAAGAPQDAGEGQAQQGSN